MNEECKNLSFSDCEMNVLKSAVDKIKNKMGRRITSNEDVKKIIMIMEDYLRNNELICYGGTAINNLLPESDQFYNKSVDVPDYDAYSRTSLEDAKRLADIYVEHGFKDVEAKSAVHFGTYKVFVNYIGVADFTQIPDVVFNVLMKKGIKKNGITYAPPNFLKMDMYKELSQPIGDVTRWEKVLKRLTLFNKHYPLKSPSCKNIVIQRPLHDTTLDNKTIYEIILKELISQRVVFFGGYAHALYSRYMPQHIKNKINDIPDFDVLSNHFETCTKRIIKILQHKNIPNVTSTYHEGIGELIPEHYEVKINNDTVLFVHKPLTCHGYNTIKTKYGIIKVASIDTMLNFYLAFLHVDLPYYTQFNERLLCMSQYLFEVQQKNRLVQKGLLKRFTVKCYGKGKTLTDVKKEKARKYRKLTKSDPEYEQYFLKYKPIGANIGSPSDDPTLKSTKKTRKKHRKIGFFQRITSLFKTLKNKT